jgi:hypothetical protein
MPEHKAENNDINLDGLIVCFYSATCAEPSLNIWGTSWSYLLLGDSI